MGANSFLADPAGLSDEELEREAVAVNSRQVDELLADARVSEYAKACLLEHRFEVERELRYRKTGEWVVPFSSFGSFEV